MTTIANLLRASAPSPRTPRSEVAADQPAFRTELQRGRAQAPQAQPQVAEHEPELDDATPTQVWVRPSQQQAASAAKELLAFMFGSGQLQQAPTVAVVATPVQPTIDPQIAIPQAAPLVFAEPLTPLEQAVHDLIGKLVADTGTPDDDDDELFAETTVVSTPDAPPMRTSATESRTAIAPAAATIRADDAPEITNTNQSHVHLVLEDGNERVVVTVAVRGTEVNVALRGSDDSTTAALARNAASLDHAMRARGLDLAEFTAEPEQRDPRPRPHHDPEPEHDAGPAFTLEETP